MLGSWSAAGVPAQGGHAASKACAAAIGDKAALVYARGANVTDDEKIVKYLNFLNWDTPEVVQDPRTPAAMIDEAVKAAQQADVVVAARGRVARHVARVVEPHAASTCRQSQRALITALKATGKPLVLVLMNGRPLALAARAEGKPTPCWRPGSPAPKAATPSPTCCSATTTHRASCRSRSRARSGRSRPTTTTRASAGPSRQGKPGNYTSQYFEEPHGALYPFGYGLSYTDFSAVGRGAVGATMPRNGKLDASVTVKNTGQRAGETVVQLYIQDVAASVVRPVKELKDFRKVMLQPGETQVVRFTDRRGQAEVLQPQLKRVAEPGNFNVQMGLDSAM